MGQLVTTGATLMCSMGLSPSTLNVTSQQTVLSDGKPVATIQDGAGMTNVPPFGMCTSLANPQVAAATSAAMGVLTPQPCVPQTGGAWIPSQVTVSAGGKPCLTNDCKLVCAYAGNISIAMPGQLISSVS
ncbi:MAG: DUF4280 domain-containing protein [Lachnospiraceae bacterium]|nr:DUF4280 domain-containing protein [Lachnospiraceae bacterium]MBQ9608688.1 DUF4280 domain-containing protein [Lachnospiraceae bacterium]